MNSIDYTFSTGYILFWIALIGLCLGSFYNVVVIRSLSGESIVFPPSKCPKCNHKLYFWHNIPILSYILLRGKCYFCHEKISIQYPLIEFITMCLFVITYLKFGLTLKTLFFSIVFSCLLIMSVTDLKEKVADCNIAIGMAFVGIVYNFINSVSDGVNSLLGLIVAVVILEIIAGIGFLFTKSRAMGEADTYIAGALGACFGFSNIFEVLFYSLLASMLVIIPMFLYKQFKQKNYISPIVMTLFLVTCVFVFKYPMNYYLLVPLIILGILLIITVIKGIKLHENITYLPFIPAFMLGTLFFAFVF